MKISLTKKPIKPMTTKPSAVLEVILVNSVFLKQGGGFVEEEEVEQNELKGGGAPEGRKTIAQSLLKGFPSRCALASDGGRGRSIVDLLRAV